jgi:hypothetical protein
MSAETRGLTKVEVELRLLDIDLCDAGGASIPSETGCLTEGSESNNALVAGERHVLASRVNRYATVAALNTRNLKKCSR